ncbi:MAG TPA: helix-turn-helix domain-containing protein [Chloroflexota bacterium]|nr:helix-turn-helix domain-containing protein [Chloroflexota bacterium]
MYSIAELQTETGASRRTIHFYVQQEILPPPVGAGPRAAYDDGHRLRLLAVPKLRSGGWRLDQIKLFFQRAPLAAIARVVETGRLPADDASWPAERGEPEGFAAAESLVRYRLAPGIELLVSTSAADDARATAERSLPLIAQLFRRME